MIFAKLVPSKYIYMIISIDQNSVNIKVRHVQIWQIQ